MAETLDARAERLGRLAFDAYADSVGGINAQGLPIPPWESLPQHIRAAWVYAALAVANAERTPDQDDAARLRAALEKVRARVLEVGDALPRHNGAEDIAQRVASITLPSEVVLECLAALNGGGHGR